MEVKSNPDFALLSALSVLATSCGFISRAVLSAASATPAQPDGDTAAAAASSLLSIYESA